MKRGTTHILFEAQVSMIGWRGALQGGGWDAASAVPPWEVQPPSAGKVTPLVGQEQSVQLGGGADTRAGQST